MSAHKLKESYSQIANQNQELNQVILHLQEKEQELLAAKQSSETANRIKTEFLATVSHEIRTPMNGVLGMTSLLLDTPLSEEQRHFVEIIRSSGETMLYLINDLLDYTKIEHGKIQLELQPFEIRPCIKDTVDLFMPIALRKAVSLYYYIHSDVPHWLIGDSTRIRQIIANLLSNAIKFTEQGKIIVSVECDSASPGASFQQIIIKVQDTGIGIPQDRQEIIFEAFAQADQSTTRKYGGTGLGLTISRKLAQMMDGNIIVESEPNQGSTFTVNLTLQTYFLPVRIPENPLAKKKILIACEDQEVLTEIVKSWEMIPISLIKPLPIVDLVFYETNILQKELSENHISEIDFINHYQMIPQIICRSDNQLNQSLFI
ncbi:MAG: ATP-binding protein, partial [Bacteroidia bacterium]|nr:ATP-binding protein [Bacteroidia bacterium]